VRGLIGNSLPKVAYSGILTANKADEYPIHYRNSAFVAGSYKEILREANTSGELPFELVFETDVESSKHNLSNIYSLCFLITRDDISSLSFLGITKTTVNVGITAIIYEMNELENKRNIVFSIPIVGYSTDLSPKERLSNPEIDKLYLTTSIKTLEYLLEKLARLQIQSLEGEVIEVVPEEIKINKGFSDGLEEGQYVKVYTETGVLTALIKKLGEKESSLEIKSDETEIYKGTIVKARNIRGLSDETYQVTRFENNSKLAGELFDDRLLSESIAQWFSDFLFSEAGKVTLPTEVSGNWQNQTDEMTKAIFVMNEDNFEFEMRKPKYPLELRLTGLATELLNENNVNENYLFKAWLEVFNPTKGTLEEFSETSTFTVVKGAFKFQSDAVFFDLLHKLANKAAKEADL